MKCIQRHGRSCSIRRREEIADFADGLDELIKGPGADAPEVRLEFREGHFDRVEIRAAGGQEQKPAAMGLLSLRVAVSLLWVARLSRMTTDPGSSSGIRTFSMQLSKASRSWAPEITRGATVPPQDRPAIKVRLPHRRNGALPLSRSPPRLRSYSRVIPVSVPVSSRKISR